MSRQIHVEARPNGFSAATFTAMASPCELLLASADPALARRLGAIAAAEVWRIEDKYSRYRDASVVSRINREAGSDTPLDPETAALMDYALLCHSLSDGRFDISSGVLRRVWRFDGSDRLPEPAAVAALLELVGLDKVRWQAPQLCLRPGMELDFGGIGKEYAADRALALVSAAAPGLPALVNLGGDLCCNRAPDAAPWQVGVERPEAIGSAAMVLELASGALATSGDTRRFLYRDGIRYGHILDPRTGWPVPDAPRSVTVAAPTCVEAGMLATFALLQGAAAEDFLRGQGVQFWCLW